MAVDQLRTTYQGSDPRWACARKKAIHDERHAKKVAHEMRSQGKDVVHYGCLFCGCYHIGRAPRG